MSEVAQFFIRYRDFGFPVSMNEMIRTPEFNVQVVREINHCTKGRIGLMVLEIYEDEGRILVYVKRNESEKFRAIVANEVVPALLKILAQQN